MTIQEKKNHILNYLSKYAFDGEYYDLVLVLKKNGIDASKEEAYSLGESLYDQGLIEMECIKDSVDGYITADGMEYLENIQISQEPTLNEADQFSKEDKVKLLSSLDELSLRISKMEMGQQIIYDDLTSEVEDLKELLNVLSKKHWSEILKGKFVDLGLGHLAKEISELLIDVFKDGKLLNS